MMPTFAASPDALLGLRELLLRLTQRVHDRRRHLRLLESADECRLVELLPPHRCRGVRQKDAYRARLGRARSCAARYDRDGDGGHGDSGEECR